jgi:signal transduction histidine kinase
VEDNGIGIDPVQQKKIFEMFQRLNPDDEAGGEGLGLSIVTRILDRLDGEIRVESESGKGSKFFIALPEVAQREHVSHLNKLHL